MPEFYKKVVASQFLLTDEQKAEMEKGETIYFDGYLVKQTGPVNFHVLVPVGDELKILRYGDWVIRHPELEIKPDHAFRAQYIAIDGFDPIAAEQKLEAFMRDRNQKSI